MIWFKHHPKTTIDHIGLIPSFLDENDPRPAREQLDEGYAHGGGWRPFKGHELTDDGLVYPGDPPSPLLASTKLRDERILVFLHAWVAIVQPDGSFEVARMD
jgi:hypothetical protein